MGRRRASRGLGGSRAGLLGRSGLRAPWASGLEPFAGRAGPGDGDGDRTPRAEGRAAGPPTAAKRPPPPSLEESRKNKEEGERKGGPRGIFSNWCGFPAGVGGARYGECLVRSADPGASLHFSRAPAPRDLPRRSQVHPFCIPAALTPVCPYHLTPDSCNGMASPSVPSLLPSLWPKTGQSPILRLRACPLPQSSAWFSHLLTLFH